MALCGILNTKCDQDPIPKPTAPTVFSDQRMINAALLAFCYSLSANYYSKEALSRFKAFYCIVFIRNIAIFLFLRLITQKNRLTKRLFGHPKHFALVEK